MSINAMTNVAMSRRPDFEPEGKVPTTFSEIAQASGVVPPRAVGAGDGGPGGGGGGGVPGGSGNANAAIQTLTTYIPTEVLTLYISAVAALGPLKNIHGENIGRWLPFSIFVALTPILVWIAFATKIKVAGKPVPVHPNQWPVWEMVAATIAFVAWAFALPNTPFLQWHMYSQALAGFIVLVSSSALGLVAPLIHGKLSA